MGVIGRRGLFFVFFAICVLCSPSAFSAPIPVRGVVEGFYGRPWTHAQRLDMLAFCGDHGMNAYVYAPKDDLFHRQKWREPYPNSQLKKLAALVREADRRQVRFIFALSPGLDLAYDGLAGAADRKRMREKLEAVYAVGVRDFAVFFDDITEKNGAGQAALLRWLDENFVKAHADVSPLVTVPTEYFLPDMKTADGLARPYTKAFAEGLPVGGLPLFTGNGVVQEGLSSQMLDEAERLYGRRLGLWWNYPVNDYQAEKLALGPVEPLPRDADIPAIFFNPMAQPELSKIALATGAAYALAPESYDPQAAWTAALQEQYGDLAPQMTLFADQAQHLENHWACIGRPNGAELRADMDALWQAWRQGEELGPRISALRQKFAALEAAADTLLERLPRKQRRECKPHLRQLVRLVKADRLALDTLEALQKGDGKRAKKLAAKLEAKRKNIEKHESKANIAEETCRAFLDETLRFAESTWPRTDGADGRLVLASR